MEEPKKDKAGEEFLEWSGASATLPEFVDSEDMLSRLTGRALTVDHISNGHVTCSYTVIPCLANYFHGLHGGVVASLAERLAIACVRTVVGEEKDLFLGEMSVSYLSAAATNAVLIADASLVKSGRNLSVVSIELKLKETAKLVYTAHATFYHLPASKL